MLATSNRAFTSGRQDVAEAAAERSPLAVLHFGREIQTVARTCERDIQEPLGLLAILRLRVFIGFRLEIADAQPCLAALGVGNDPNRAARRCLSRD